MACGWGSSTSARTPFAFLSRPLDEGSLVSIREDRAQLGLGEEIERTGRIGEKKLSDAAETAKAHVRRARKLGCTSIAVLVTSPGRQAANGQELVSRLAAATGVPTRVLTAQEEAELAWRGAVTASTNLPATVAVCDVGGGSAQIAVGTGTPSLVGAIARHRLSATHPACVSKRSTRRRGRRARDRHRDCGVRRTGAATAARRNRGRRHSPGASQGRRRRPRRGNAAPRCPASVEEVVAKDRKGVRRGRRLAQRR